MTKKPSTLSTAERIRLAATKERRSTLYRWMLAHHDEFSATVAEAGRPNWQELAKAFGDEGLRDLRDNRPTGEGARQTWFKVRTAVKKAQSGQARHPSKPASQPPSAPSSETPQLAVKSATPKGPHAGPNHSGPTDRRFTPDPSASQEDKDRLLGDLIKPRK